MHDESPKNSGWKSRRLAATAVAVAGALALSAAFIPTFDSFGPGASAQNARVEQTAQPLGERVDPMSRAPLSFADIVKKVRPAVVSVNVQVKVPGTSSDEDAEDQQGQMPNFRDLPQDHPFNEFFKKFFGEPGTPQPFRGPRGQRPPGRAQGSGFIISEDGFVVTNNHVVDNASTVELTLDDGTKHEADLIGKDSKTDLALLKIKNTDMEFPYVAFSEKDIEIGDWVVAVGNPFGLGGTVTAGIVSARGRDIGAGPYDDFIQIDASINRGNSGGPAFNLDGEVVGVNTAIFSPSGGSIGIGFAIPVNIVRDVVAQLKESGSVTRGWLGVQIQTVDEDIAGSLGLDKANGAIVAEVFGDSPASSAGLKANDVILAIDGTSIADAKDLARKIGDMKPDQTIKVTVFREGKRETVDVLLGTQPAGDVAQADKPEEEEPAKAQGESKVAELGLSLAPASEVPGATGDGVVVVGVDANSEAAEKGIEVGDTILQINGKSATTPEDVLTEMRAVAEAGRSSVLFRIRSGERPRFVVLDVKKG